MIRKVFATLTLVLILISGYSQRGFYKPIDLSKVHWCYEDFGQMYTFDNVPVDKIYKQYGFQPTGKWLEKVRLAAVRLSTGCSGSFVSRDGLIMTNHHCVRALLKTIERPGENIYRDGFYADTSATGERRIPNLYVEQLIKIIDVTDQVHQAMNQGQTDSEKVALKKQIIKKLEKKYSNPKKNIVAQVITLYYGGKYSLYVYKRYTDVRLVMVPDVQIASTGWDWDNFTYPRYELDFAFLRAYENGKPVKVKNYFTWSKQGAKPDQTVFVVGNPGNTDRLLSVEQLEFFKNYRIPVILYYLDALYDAQYEYFKTHPQNKARELSHLLGIANGRKYYAGLYKALRDPYIMAKKNSFEKDLKKRVKADSALSAKYGDIWTQIQSTLDDMKQFYEKYLLASLLLRMPSAPWQTAKNLYLYANGQLNKPFNELYVPIKDSAREALNARAIVEFIRSVKGENCSILYMFENGSDPYASLLKSTSLDDRNFAKELYDVGAAAILDSDDPLIIAMQNIYKTINQSKQRLQNDENKLEVLNQKLGYLIYLVYGDTIPPDATFSLRFQPGKIKGYEYNGTLAPPKTTFYGLYDRYYSFGQKAYPWGLHPRWLNPPKQFKLKTFVGFASTNDIVGGNSGSPVINKDLQIVGIVHDGNIESLAGAYIYLPDDNRAVASDSWGMIEALKYIYKTDKLVKELQTSKMPK